MRRPSVEDRDGPAFARERLEDQCARHVGVDGATPPSSIGIPDVVVVVSAAVGGGGGGGGGGCGGIDRPNASILVPLSLAYPQASVEFGHVVDRDHDRAERPGSVFAERDA